MDQGKRLFFRLVFPSNGLTIQLSAICGRVVCYASDRLTNPTGTQGYEWRVETDDYKDVFIDPILLNRDPGQYIYISVEGIHASNNFSLNSTAGDHRGLHCLIASQISMLYVHIFSAVPFDVSVGTSITSSLVYREVIYYKFSFPSTGLTLVLDIPDGSVVCYASDTIQNPNPRNGYSWRFEASYYNDSYIDPSMVQGAVMHVGIEGRGNASSNIFSLNSTFGDSATKGVRIFSICIV